jgi:hypothetical protein
MDKQPQSRVPLSIAIVVLLLPMRYVGSYLVLVLPRGRYVERVPDKNEFVLGPLQQKVHYRVVHQHAARFFWPPSADRPKGAAGDEEFAPKPNLPLPSGLHTSP